jgi:uncharacterized cupredoxin-like copper-binding protein
MALENIRCSDHLSVHIADNGSSPDHVEALLRIAKKAGVERITTSIAEGGGYGRNYNVATQVIHESSDILLMLEDDWELMHPFDLSQHIQTLEMVEGCIRLGHLSITQGIVAELRNFGGSLYWHLLPNSPDQYVFTGHPRLETRAWEVAVGPWPEGLGAGAVELLVCGRPAARTNVLWPVGQASGEVFAHIGTEHA